MQLNKGYGLKSIETQIIHPLNIKRWQNWQKGKHTFTVPMHTLPTHQQWTAARSTEKAGKGWPERHKIPQERLLERGYSKSCLKKAYKRAIERTRSELIYGTKKDKKSDDTTRIILKYSNQHTRIRNIIQKYWHLLSVDPNVGRFVTNTIYYL